MFVVKAKDAAESEYLTSNMPPPPDTFTGVQLHQSNTSKKEAIPPKNIELMGTIHSGLP